MVAVHLVEVEHSTSNILIIHLQYCIVGRIACLGDIGAYRRKNVDMFEKRYGGEQLN